jgi:hypothetical protein
MSFPTGTNQSPTNSKQGQQEPAPHTPEQLQASQNNGNTLSSLFALPTKCYKLVVGNNRHGKIKHVDCADDFYLPLSEQTLESNEGDTSTNITSLLATRPPTTSSFLCEQDRHSSWILEDSGLMEILLKMNIT